MGDSLVNLSSAYEARTLDALTKPFILPVTIVTGFLGSGKTTLLQNLMRKKRNLRLATLVNDFGGVNYDSDLLGRTSTPARNVDLHDGCMCCHSTLKDRLRDHVWEMLQTPDDLDNKAIDYLVIETSGVSAPEALIAMLDQRFGRMTRARLDSVVTLVDAEALHALATSASAAASSSSATSSEALSAATGVAGEGRDPAEAIAANMPHAMRSQIKHADVVILNKMDLLPSSPQGTQDSAVVVEAGVRLVNPSARLLWCSYGDVALPLVLDVDLPDPSTQQGAAPALSHEAGQACFVASGSKRHRSQASHLPTTNPLSANPQGPVLPTDHLLSDGLVSLTFDSPRPLVLARLQAFLHPHTLPRDVLRIKGVLHVREAGGQRWRLSLSGARRLCVDNDGGWGHCAPRTQLVVIGKGLDTEALHAALEDACTDPVVPQMGGAGGGGGGRDRVPASGAAALCDVIRADDRMELVGATSAADPAVNGDKDNGVLVRFRLNGARALGMSEEHVAVKHGVDVEGMNEELVRRVNLRAGQGGQGLVMLWPMVGEGGKREVGVWVGEGGEEEVVAFYRGVVAQEASGVVKEFMAHVQLCKCGH